MRLSFLLLGHLCLAVGTVGLFVPLLPTTPFVLLAAFCYSKGSLRLHRWLTAHPRFGGPIRDWQRHGVIRPRAKWVSTLLIVASLAYPVGFKDLPLAVKVFVVLIGVGVLAFLHSRPSVPAPRAAGTSEPRLSGSGSRRAHSSRQPLPDGRGPERHYQ